MEAKSSLSQDLGKISQNIWQPYWDKVQMTGVAQDYLFFRDTAGKQKFFSNLGTAGQIPAGKQLNIQAIAVELWSPQALIPGVIAANILKNSQAMFTLHLDSNIALEIPLNWIPSGHGMVFATTESDELRWSNGVASSKEAYIVAPNEIKLPAGTQFDVTIGFAGTAPDLTGGALGFAGAIYLGVALIGPLSQKAIPSAGAR